MKHQKTLVRLAVSSVLGASLYASNLLSLGLGDIESKTQLNQPLQAKIKLLSAQEFTQEELTARIASFEAYGKFGVLREPVHGQLKFQIETHSNGAKYINVTSNQAIKEPFLNFLVELNWPQGRLLREYTVLLDPPALSKTKQEIVTVNQPKPVSQPTVTSTPISKPVTESKPVNRRVETKPKTSTPKITKPRVQYEGDSWRVGQGETLWSIATRLTPDEATVSQTLAALYRNNPNAFINNDIDRLKAGSILSLPTNNMIQSVDSRISYNDLKANSSASAPLDVRKEVNERSASNESSSSGRLTISSVDDSELTDDTGANISDGTDDLAGQVSKGELVETVEALRLENEQLKAELVAVKGVDKNAVALEDETLSVIAGSAEGKDSDDEALQALATEAESVINDTESESAVETKAEAEEVATPEVSASETPVETVEPSFWEKDGFWKWPLIILASLLSLLGFGFLIKKRQSSMDEDVLEVESVVSEFKRQQPSFTETAMPAPEIESDPLDQADILIARGRFNEVEDLLLSALEQDPENHAARVKLMEVYSSDENISSFKEQYLALPDSFDHDSELGLKVAAMMQLHQEPANLEVETSIDEDLFIDEEQVFGQEASDASLDLTEELDDILHKAVETESANVEADENIVDSSEAILEDDNMLEFSLDDSDTETVQDASEDENFAEELSDEEGNTKLELAKAYISMGDEESALEILKEVKKEGSAEQRQLAEELIADL